MESQMRQVIESCAKVIGGSFLKKEKNRLTEDKEIVFVLWVHSACSECASYVALLVDVKQIIESYQKRPSSRI